MNPEYKGGFYAGYKLAFNANPDEPVQCEKGFVFRGNLYYCGYSEGIISGRLDKLTKIRGEIKSKKNT